MKIKSLFVIICFIGFNSIVSAQEYAIDKKATIFTGSGSFMSNGGEIYVGSSSHRINSLTISPTINHFITRNLFIGLATQFSRSSQSDLTKNSLSTGPQIGFAWGNANNKVYPFIDLGVLYNITTFKFEDGGKTKASGSKIDFGIGVIIPIKTHIGLIFEAGYQIENVKIKVSNESSSGNIFFIGFGIAGLLF